MTVRDRRWAIGVFVVVFATHAASPVATSADSRWTVPIALSLWERGDLNLDEYPAQLRQHKYAGTQCIAQTGESTIHGPSNCAEGHWYTLYPAAGPILASPFVYALGESMQSVVPLISGFRTGRPMLDAFLSADLLNGYGIVEVIVASLFVALTAAVMFLIIRRYVSAGAALALAGVFAYATPAWSTASRAFWQHTPSMLIISVTLFLLLEGEKKKWCVGLSGLPVALSYLVRPTNSLFVMVVTCYVFSRFRKQFPYFIASALPLTVLFLGYNYALYNSPLPYYFRLSPPTPEWSGVTTALAGNLISPSRGLLIFSPVFLFSVWGMVHAWTSGASSRLWRYLSAWVLLHWWAISLYVEFWWAGFSYGPRLFTDLTPALVLFLVPVVHHLQDRRPAWRPAAVVLGATILISVWVHGRGALRFEAQRWNATPVSVDEDPSRVWNWRDPQFLR